MAQDVQILPFQVKDGPNEWIIPDALVIMPKAVRAVFDGTAASGAFLPALEIVSDSGHVVATCITGSTVAAGASAEVSWFRRVTATTAQPATSAYQTIVLAAGPSGYYKKDELSGTTLIDSSGNGRNGGYTNAPTLGANPLIGAQVVGNVGSAVTYNAALSQFATTVAGTWPVTEPANYSIECWVKTTQSGVGNPQIVCSDNGGGQRYFQFRLSAAGTLEFIVFSAALAATTKTGAVTINDGARHYLVGTFDGADNVIVYVDGVQDGAAVAGPAAHATQMQKFGIAERFHGVDDSFFTGTIDEVAFYPYALSAIQVAAHYAAA